MEVQPKDTSKGHFYVSLLKSALRIGAGVALWHSMFMMSAALFIVAELLGVLEELV